MAEKTFAQVHRQIQDLDIEFIDLKMLDLTGRLHHISLPADRFTEDVLQRRRRLRRLELRLRQGREQRHGAGAGPGHRGASIPSASVRP